jgi:ornithine cyclodeaminase
VLVLSRREVEGLLHTDRLVDALSAAMVGVAAGRVSMPPRIAARVEQHDGILAAMPAYLPSANALTTKLVSLFPNNRDRPTHQAVIVCFDPENGTPLALLDGTAITEARTAAGSVLASRHLARAGARVVTIIGSGVQARAHARAFASWAGLESVVVAARNPESVATLVRELVALGLPAEAASSLPEAVGSADIICATTHADVPVVRRPWVRAGTHINSVGYNTAGDGEVDVALIRDAVVVVESREAALAPPPSGAVELRRAIEAGIADPVNAEIGAVIAGSAIGRDDDRAITLYKSVGIAAQDAAAASLVLAAAKASAAGLTVDM